MSRNRSIEYLLPDLSSISLSTLDDSHNQLLLLSTSSTSQEPERDWSDAGVRSGSRPAASPEKSPPALLNGRRNDSSIVSVFLGADSSSSFLVVDEARDVQKLLDKASRRFGHQETSKLDESLLDGTAEGIAQTLHRVLLDPSSSPTTTDGHQENQQEPKYRSSLDYSRVIQVTILCRTLELLMRCSDDAVKIAMERFGTKLLGPTLPQVIQIVGDTIAAAPALAMANESSLQTTILTSCLCILRRTGHHLMPQPAVSVALVKALLPLLEPSLGLCCDSRVGAASSIARCLEYHSHSMEPQHELLKMVDDSSTVLISILSTAALVVTDELLEQCLMGMYKLARLSRLGQKLARRRCALLVVRQYVFHNALEIRINAIILCEALLLALIQEDYESTRETESMLVTTLLRASMEEADLTVKMHTIEILRGLAKYTNSNSSNRITAILRMLRYHSESVNTSDPELAIKASLYYLEIADKIPLNEEIAKNIVEYLQSPSRDVRIAAIRALNYMSFWDPHIAVFFIENTNLLNVMCFLIIRGSPGEAMETMEVCKQISFDSRVLLLLCQHKRLVKTLVVVVISEPVVTNRQVYANAVSVILDLMSDDERLPFFKVHSKLLPWLVRFANRTTGDEELKRRVVNTIVRLSTCLLDGK